MHYLKLKKKNLQFKQFIDDIAINYKYGEYKKNM